MDVLPASAQLSEGMYLLRFVEAYDVAKMDEYLVQISAVRALRTIPKSLQRDD